MALTPAGKDLNWFAAADSVDSLPMLPSLASSSLIESSKPLAVVLAHMPPLVSPENAGNVPAVRAALRAQADPALVEQFRLPVAEVRDKTVPGDGGDIPVRV